MSQSNNKTKSEPKVEWHLDPIKDLLPGLSIPSDSDSTDSQGPFKPEVSDPIGPPDSPGTFQPEVGTSLTINKATYHVTEHPIISRMPYGLQARRATVYQLKAPDGGLYALKVFNPAWRTPHVANEQLRCFAHLPGLQVCTRTVLTREHHAELLGQYANLTYAVLMPWIVGETWQEVMLDEESEFTSSLSHTLAQALAQVLATMEQRHLAHCDLSGANIVVKRKQQQVELIDVEDLYAPELTQPEKLPGGSLGYAHREAHHGLWSADADRFAGAVLLAEILGWCDPRIREKAHGEQYFAPDEMQKECERFQLMLGVLRERWGEPIAEAFKLTWHSSMFAECVPFTEWEQLLRTQNQGMIEKIKIGIRRLIIFILSIIMLVSLILLLVVITNYFL